MTEYRFCKVEQNSSAYLTPDPVEVQPNVKMVQWREQFSCLSLMWVVFAERDLRGSTPFFMCQSFKPFGGDIVIQQS